MMTSKEKGLESDNNLTSSQSSLKFIITKTISMIDQSKQQVYGIIEKNRSEYEQMKRDLERMRLEAETIITQVDMLEVKDKMMRQKLAEMSKNFKRYSEAEVKKFYDAASDVRIQYITKQNEERSLIERRNQLEISLKRFEGIIKDAENVIHQVSIAMGYLKGEIFSALEELSGSDKMLLGIRILEAQEEERRRIARDIHDGPAQAMANVIMKADLCEYITKMDVDKGLMELNELKTMVHDSLKEVRDIIFDLRPMSLDDLGLPATLERYVERLQQDKKINIHLVIKKGNHEPEHIIAVGLYRITQEILNNILKHAKATQIKMLLEFGSKYIRLIVVNDGVGFNVDETLERVKNEGGSFGLIGMLERTKQLGGTLEIQSEETTGSQFRVMVPINRDVLKESFSEGDT